MKKQIPSELETELMFRKFVDAEFLRRCYTAIRKQIGVEAAQAFARTLLTMKSFDYPTFLAELERLAARNYCFQKVRVKGPDGDGETEALKAEFFSTPIHQEGIPEDELRTLPLMTA